MQSASRPARPGDGDSDINDIKHTCYACKATFRDYDALRNHKIQMRDEESSNEPYLTHVYCHYCDQDFMTERAGKQHWEQFHAEKQDINCPGCDQHFVQFSAFVRHIEFHECPVISQENAAARCQKELDFARALERIDRMSRGVHRAKDFTSYLGGDRGSSPTKHLPARPAIPNGPSTFWPSDAQVPDKSEFPRLPNREYYHGNTDIPDLLTGDENHTLHGKEGEDPWASARTHSPQTSAAENTKPQQMMQLQLLDQAEDEWQREENAMTKARGLVKADPDDPSGHNFDPKKLFCPYTKLYKCPRCKKGKGFKQWSALKQHMQSAAHAFTKTVACPWCKDSFKHLFSLAAHVESADKKCNLKHSDIFEIFLGQLTWNLIEVTGHHKNDRSIKFAISKKAEQDYGIAEPARPQLTFGHHQMHGSQSSINRPQLTSSALAELEKQPNQPLPSFMTSHQEMEAQEQFPPLKQGQQPRRTHGQIQRVQKQTPVLPQMSQAHYRQQFPSLQQQSQPQSPQGQAKIQTPSQPQRSHGQYDQQQSQQPRIWQRPQAQAQAQHQSQSQLQQQQPPRRMTHGQLQLSVQQQHQHQQQSRRLQARQQPVRGLGSGLTDLTLARIPSFPFDKPDGDEEAWSNDSIGDGDGDAGW